MLSLVTWRLWFCLTVIILCLPATASSSMPAQAQGKPGVFFSQGQAIFDPQNRSKSQREAVQNFLVQALTQAAAAYLSPAQLGKHYATIQEKILQQPNRYVLTYQIYSEDPGTGGLYRVTGQATIAMELLKNDLMALGLAGAEAEKPPGLVSTPKLEAPEEDRTVNGSGKAGDAIKASSMSRSKVLWAVAEKWDQDWHVPGDRRDPEALFAASVFQESQDYGWDLQVPEAGTLAPNPDGLVSSSQSLNQAQTLGLHHVVVGKIGLVKDQTGEAYLETSLRLLQVSSGRALGEIHKDWPIADDSSQEAAIELASFVTAQLDRQLREGGPPDEVVDNAALKGEAGELVLQIRSNDSYNDWLTLEAMLREKFKGMEVKGFEIRPEESMVRLLGVDETGLKNLNGTRLPNGAEVKIMSRGTEGHVFTVTLSRPQISSPGPAQ
jgi:hypothetical protein